MKLKSGQFIYLDSVYGLEESLNDLQDESYNEEDSTALES